MLDLKVLTSFAKITSIVGITQTVVRVAVGVDTARAILGAIVLVACVEAFFRILLLERLNR